MAAIGWFNKSKTPRIKRGISRVFDTVSSDSSHSESIKGEIVKLWSHPKSTSDKRHFHQFAFQKQYVYTVYTAVYVEKSSTYVIVTGKTIYLLLALGGQYMDDTVKPTIDGEAELNRRICFSSA
ncbi:unnamed protein product [Callosobruchus maculatus]|uniref:Uncharacterized protein n=1 Tax=Callosobruchus maculatus TaxID=64391 RepID=A0A653BQN4_CALMS|nr:unnamed protein product [Callosobruchus maculatus]